MVALHRQVLESRPDSFRGWFQQAEELKCQGFLIEALHSFDRALQYYQHDYYSWYYRGQILEEINSF